MPVRKGKIGSEKLKRFNEPLSMIPCSECRIGQMRKSRVTHFTWAGNEMITVPDFPAWVCDICGKREYDVEALNRLSLVLFPPAASDEKYTSQYRSNPGTRPHPSK